VRKLVLLLVAALGVYVLWACWSPLQKYVVMRHAAQSLAVDTARTGRQNHGAITAMRDEVEKATGIALYGGNIDVRATPGCAEVRVNAAIPVHLPIVNHDFKHQVELQVESCRRMK
jgi:hypothetical protein